ncbi:hypothetical protein [Ramlibacter humi]|uniref:Uncharacterized protein n=1 Tax=Ramlibacter humi TaxID=2530451 RepID=A0A4Z0BHW5_9BURK|nr:hypothetical protein [Ramlibacter humi]TFY97714.1 hypothetical protein EZ216_18505 [Ramlibacter humi]
MQHARGGLVMTVDAVAGVQAHGTWYEAELQHEGAFELAALKVVDDSRRTWATAQDPRGDGAAH